MSRVFVNSDRRVTDLKRLHHVGYVVASIANVVEEFAAGIEATWDGQITTIPSRRCESRSCRLPVRQMHKLNSLNRLPKIHLSVRF